MENRLKSIEDKVDEVNVRLAKVDTHMAVYNEQLRSHIKRTEVLEREHIVFRKVVYGLMGIGGFFAFLATAAVLFQQIKG